MEELMAGCEMLWSDVAIVQAELEGCFPARACGCAAAAMPCGFSDWGDYDARLIRIRALCPTL
jgi:hypothetical protein